MRLVSQHAPGTPHRVWLEAYATDCPWAFVIPSGSRVLEASGEQWSSPYPVVALFWPGAFYQVMMLLKPFYTDYYCNIITPVRYDVKSGEVRFTDLDLDVTVTQGEISVLDEDEFLARKRGYSAEWIRSANAAVQRLTDMAHRQAGPFSPAASEWWRAYICQPCSLRHP